jgi:subtilase family serine protease
VFTGWSGDCTGTGDCVLTMTEARNVTATFAIAGIDLRVSAATALPAVASPGSAYVVTDTTTNAGASAAAASTTRIYLSVDAILGKGDVRLGGRPVPGLASGEASVGASNVTVPASMAVGTYWQLTCADDALAVAESNETNNCLVSQTPVEIRLPDLRVALVVDPPAVVAPGAKFTAGDTVLNDSAVFAGASMTRFYLSTDGVKDASDVLLTGSRKVVALAGAEASAGSATVTVPAGTSTGSYRLIACADAASKVRESNEANNCTTSAGSVLVAEPDLVLSQVSGVPATIRLGQKMTLSDTVTNVGQGPAGASTTRFYLSLDTTWALGDVVLSGARSVVALAGGAASTGSKAVTVPITVLPGTYYVLACADDARKVAESDETNNCTASGSTLVVQP